jgi:multidrug transporter EmrE-like cation transporter
LRPIIVRDKTQRIGRCGKMEMEGQALYYAALAGSIVLGVGAQILLKSGADRAGAAWLPQFVSPFTIGGLILYAVAFFFYIVALRRIPLSLAFPAVSVSYFVVAAHYLWGEPFGWAQFAGLVLIGAGIAMLHQG